MAEQIRKLRGELKLTQEEAISTKHRHESVENQLAGKDSLIEALHIDLYDQEQLLQTAKAERDRAVLQLGLVKAEREDERELQERTQKRLEEEEERAAALGRECEEKEALIEELHATVNESGAATDRLRREMDVAQQKLQETQALVDRASSDSTALTRDRARLESQVLELRDANAELLIEKNDALQLCQDLREVSEGVGAGRTKTAEKEELRRRNVLLITELSDTRQKFKTYMNAYSKTVTSLRAQRDECREDLAKATLLHKDCDGERENLQRVVAEQLIDVKEAEGKTGKLHARAKELREEKRLLQKKARLREDSLRELRRKLEVKTSLHERVRGEKKKLTAELQKKTGEHAEAVERKEEMTAQVQAMAIKTEKLQRVYHASIEARNALKESIVELKGVHVLVLSDARKELNSALRTAKSAKNKVKHMEGREQQLSERASKLKAQLDKAREARKLLTAEHAQCGALSSALKAAQRKVAAATERVRALNASNNKLTRTVEKNSLDMKDMRRHRIKLDKRIELLKADKGDLAASIKENQEQSQHQDQAAARLKDQISKLDELVRKQQEEIEGKQDSIAQVRREKDDLIIERRELKKTIDERRREANEVVKESKLLRREKQQLIGQVEN